MLQVHATPVGNGPVGTCIVDLTERLVRLSEREDNTPINNGGTHP